MSWRRDKRRWVLIGGGLLVGGALFACSTTPDLLFAENGADSGTGEDGSTTTPPTPPGPPTPPTPPPPPGDGGNDGATGLDGATDAPLGDGGTDAAIDAPYTCGSGKVSDCALCDGGRFFLCTADNSCTNNCKNDCGNGINNRPVECVACNAGGQPVRRVCEFPLNATNCLSGLQRCPCTGNNPATCFGPRQVCNGNACTACGENNTDGKNCQGGNQCDNIGMNQYECN